MITSGQRAKLRSLAQTINPICQIGKFGVGDTQIAEIDTALELHELIKISVLRNADASAKEMLNTVANLLHAEPITAIGNKIVLYRRSSRDDVEHIVF